VNERSALLAGVLILVIAVAAIAGTRLGPSSDKIVAGPLPGDTPGYASTRAHGTTSEPTFELAGPRSRSGPTTIPGAGPTFFVPSASTVPATVSPPTTSGVTTTTLPPIPDAPPGDDACRALNQFFQFVRVGARVELPFGPYVQYVDSQLTEMVRLLRKADATAYQQMIGLLGRLRSDIDAAPDRPHIDVLMTSFLSRDNQPVLQSIRPLGQHAASACPDLRPTVLHVLLGG
jgi:hypothetical protein